MSRKKLYNKTGIVYSTAPDFGFKNEDEEVESRPPKEQMLKVVLDTKHRAGKTASVIKGFEMKEEEIATLLTGEAGGGTWNQSSVRNVRRAESVAAST